MTRTSQEIEKKVEQLRLAVFDALCKELQPGIVTQCDALRDEADRASSEEGASSEICDKLRAKADEIEAGASENWKPLAKAVAYGVVTFLIGVADDQTNRGVACISDAGTDKEFWTWFTGMAAALTGWAKKPAGSLDELRTALGVLTSDPAVPGAGRTAPTSLTGEIR